MGHFVLSPSKNEIEEIVEEMKERDSKERGKGMKVKKKKKYKNSAEGSSHLLVLKSRATIRMWLLNKFISFLAVLSWKTGLKKM